MDCNWSEQDQLQPLAVVESLCSYGGQLKLIRKFVKLGGYTIVTEKEISKFRR